MTRILHISDLHLSKAEFIDKRVVNTHFDDDANFTDKLIKSINDNCQNKLVDKIIVSGDLANKSEEEEYQLVEKFLNDLSGGIKVGKENIRIIPGNHDINWELSKGY